MSKITFQADKDRRDDAHVSCLQEETISLYTPLTSDSSIPVPIIKLAKQRASRVITLDNHIQVYTTYVTTLYSFRNIYF